MSESFTILGCRFCLKTDRAITMVNPMLPTSWKKSIFRDWIWLINVNSADSRLEKIQKLNPAGKLPYTLIDAPIKEKFLNRQVLNKDRIEIYSTAPIKDVVNLLLQLHNKSRSY